MNNKLIDLLIDEANQSVNSTQELAETIQTILQKRSFPLPFIEEYTKLRQLNTNELRTLIEDIIRKRPTTQRLTYLETIESDPSQSSESYRTFTKLIRQYERTLTKRSSSPGDNNVKDKLLYEIQLIYTSLTTANKSRAQKYLRPLVCRSIVMNSIALIKQTPSKLEPTNSRTNRSNIIKTNKNKPQKLKSLDQNQIKPKSEQKRCQLPLQSSRHIAIDTTSPIPLTIDFKDQVMTFNSANGNEFDRFLQTFFKQRSEHRNLPVQLFIEAIESYYE